MGERMDCKHRWLETYNEECHRINICAKCGLRIDVGIPFYMLELLSYPKPSGGFCIPFEELEDDDI